MGCGNSKAAEKHDDFGGKRNATSDKSTPTQPKVYRNYVDKEDHSSPEDFSDSHTDDISDELHKSPPRKKYSDMSLDNSSDDSDENPKSDWEEQSKVVPHSRRKSTSDELTSDEDVSSAYNSPTHTSRHPSKSPKTTPKGPQSSRSLVDSFRDNGGNEDDFMTPVVIGHGHQLPRHSHSTVGDEEDPADAVKVERPEASLASEETKLKAIVRMQKLFRQRKHWEQVIEEREWKIFNDLDTQDEADMLNLACFMQTMLDWNSAQSGDDHCPTKSALQQDSDSEDHHPHSNGLEQPAVKRDTSRRKAQFSSVSVHSAQFVHGNSDDFTIPKGPLNSKVAKDIIAVYKRKGRLSLKSIQKILRFSYKSFKKLNTVSHVTLEKGEKVTVVGDLHGQLGDLFHILEESGWPSPTNKYIFNGDFVDRGEQGVEVVCVLLSLFAAMPHCVYMNRGNHEDHAICCVYGFEKELKTKYDELTFGMFVEIFRHIPLFTLVNEEVFVVHGGLFHDVNVKLADLADIERTDYSAKPPVPYPECCDGLGAEESRREYLKQLQRDALWSDPNEFEILSKNSRGSGVVFGPEVTRRFLKNNNLRMVVRSHECVRRGFDQPFSGSYKPLLCTVFSASNYCGGHNDAAYLTFARHAMTGGQALSHSTCNMHFSVHHFNLTDAKQSLKDSNHDNIRELILRKSKALQQAFETADVTCSKTVTKMQWSEIMQRVTNLKIMWLAILKELSPTCISGNIIYYAMFLKGLKKTVEDSCSVTVDSLYGQRQKLETIFHFFDKNGDGTISREEFRKGCDFMNTTLPPDQQLRDYDHILTLMDFDQSDSIDINEFFEVFRILDAKDGVVDGVISLAAKGH